MGDNLEARIPFVLYRSLTEETFLILLCARARSDGKSQGGVQGGGTNANLVRSAANALKSKQAYIHSCLSDTRLSKSQVCCSGLLTFPGAASICPAGVY